jgi:hypothetical protein
MCSMTCQLLGLNNGIGGHTTDMLDLRPSLPYTRATADPFNAGETMLIANTGGIAERDSDECSPSYCGTG